MSRELKALRGAQRAMADATITDVALTYPKGSTMAGAIGVAVGQGVAQATGATGAAWQMAGMVIGQRVGAERAAMPNTVVLAASPSTVYALGRNRTGLFGGWNTLRPLAAFPRQQVRVTHRRRGAIVQIELVDTTSGTTLQLESRAIGGLGVGQLLQSIER